MCFSQIFCKKYISSTTPHSKIPFENWVCIWLSILQETLQFMKYLSPLLISIISYLKNSNFHKTVFTEHFSCWRFLSKDQLRLFFFLVSYICKHVAILESDHSHEVFPESMPYLTLVCVCSMSEAGIEIICK